VFIQISAALGITIIGLVPLEIHLAAFMFARAARTSVTEPSVADLLAWNNKFWFCKSQMLPKWYIQNAKILKCPEIG
jgi:hypothetical protein